MKSSRIDDATSIMPRADWLWNIEILKYLFIAQSAEWDEEGGCDEINQSKNVSPFEHK